LRKLSNYTEAQIIDTITKVAKRVSHKFSFGHYDSDDIFQEAFMLGLRGLDSYEEGRPLENFISVVISSRLKNLKRKHSFRPEPELGTPEHDEWIKKFASRKYINEPLSIYSIKDEQESGMWNKMDFLNEMQVADIFNVIDINLPVHLRADFLRMKQGIFIAKPRRERVEAVIITILEENGYETW
jgi:hypothetical protein